MTLDQFLQEVRERRLLLISEREIWPSPLVTRDITRALRRHQSGVAVLLRWSDIRTCASPTHHRKYWKHVGGQQYTCEICQSLLQEVS